MGKESNNPDKYWRSGIAIPVEKKHLFTDRMDALQLKTSGDLINLFMHAPGVVEALAPIAQAYREQKASVKSVGERRKEAVDKIKGMTPDELEYLVALASQHKSE